MKFSNFWNMYQMSDVNSFPSCHLVRKKYSLSLNLSACIFLYIQSFMGEICHVLFFIFSASCQTNYLTVMILSKLPRPCNSAPFQSFSFCITRVDISIVFHLIKINNLIFALTGTVFAVRPHSRIHYFLFFSRERYLFFTLKCQDPDNKPFHCLITIPLRPFVKRRTDGSNVAIKLLAQELRRYRSDLGRYMSSV